MRPMFITVMVSVCIIIAIKFSFSCIICPYYYMYFDYIDTQHKHDQVGYLGILGKITIN